MQIKQAIARFALKALGPQYTAGLMYSLGGITFRWGLADDTAAYNNKIVYSALNIIVPKLVESTILVASKTRNAKAANKYYSKTATNEWRAMYQAKAFKELEQHPLIDLMETPNGYQTGLEMWETFWFNYCLGDGYIIPEFPGEESRKSGQPIHLHAINRNRVTPVTDLTRPYNPVAYYRVQLYNGTYIDIAPDRIFHLKRWNPDGSSGRGYDTVKSAEKNISKNEQNQVAQGTAFVNGGRGVMFSSDMGVNTQTGTEYEKMTAEQMAALKQTVERDYAGAMNNRRMHFTNGYVNVQNYGDTLAEMQLIESEKSDWRDIFAVFGIPVSLGPTGEALTDNNLAAQMKRLVTESVIPQLKKFDMKFNAFISGWYPSPVVVYHDLTEFEELAPNMKLLKDIFGDVPWLTFDEVRRLFKYDETNLPYMKEFYIRAGYVTVKSISEPSEYLEPGDDSGDYR